MDHIGPDKILDDELRSFIYSKLLSYFKKDQCLGTLNINSLLAPLRKELMIASSVHELLGNINANGLNETISISRKVLDRKTRLYFEYPSLSRQIESIVYAWNDVVRIQQAIPENLQKAISEQSRFLFEGSDRIDTEALDTSRNTYGNKPNLAISVPESQDIPVQLELHQARLLFPLTLDFTYEYNSFRRRVIQECEKTRDRLKQTKSSSKLLYVQTDIERFFHTIKLSSLRTFLTKDIGENSPLIKMIYRLEQDGYRTLPIGWVLSRFLANFVVSAFHSKISSSFANNLEQILQSTSSTTVVKGAKLPAAEDLASVRFHSLVSYVDDLVFILSCDADKTTADFIADQIVKEATNILNHTLPNNREFKIHALGSKKMKTLLIEPDRIKLLASNFVILQTGDSYSDEENDLRARLADLLAPADNDIDFNEVGFFRNQLRRLKELIITRDYDNPETLLDTIDTLKIKVEHESGKYIRLVLNLVATAIETPSLESIHERLRTKTLRDIVDSYKRNHKTIPDALKLLTGLFQFCEATEFCRPSKSILKSTFSWAIRLADKTSNDTDLLEALYETFRLRAAKKGCESLKRTRSHIKSPLMHAYSDNSDRLADYYCGESSQLRHQSVIELLIGGRNFKHGTRYPPMIPKVREAFNNSLDSKDTDVFLLELIQAHPFLVFQNEDILRRLADSQNADVVLASGLITVLKTFEFEFTQFLMQAERQRLVDFPKLMNHFENQFAVHLHKFGIQTRLILIAALRAGSFRELVELILPLSNPVEGRSFYRWFSTKPFLRVGLRSYGIVRALLTTWIAPSTNIWQIQTLNRIELIELISQSIAWYKVALESPDRAAEGMFKTAVDIDELSKDFRFSKNFDKPMKVTLSPLRIDYDTETDKTGLLFKDKLTIKRIENAILQSLIEGKRHGTSIVVFPELTIPRASLSKVLQKAASLDIVLIGGIEYEIEPGSPHARNLTIISFPTRKRLHPISQNYIAFLQPKNFPAADEDFQLATSNLNFSSGNGVFIFKSEKWGDFGILTCSDYLSLTLRWMIQGEVQSVFVPAQNKDSSTYHHISETCIRDLHALALVCNNSAAGASFCYAPMYHPNRRTIFRIEGSSSPETHTFEVKKISYIRKTQKLAAPHVPFRPPKGVAKEHWERLKIDSELAEFKQLPPDWRRWKK